MTCTHYHKVLIFFFSPLQLLSEPVCVLIYVEMSCWLRRSAVIVVHFCTSRLQSRWHVKPTPSWPQSFIFFFSALHSEERTIAAGKWVERRAGRDAAVAHCCFYNGWFVFARTFELVSFVMSPAVADAADAFHTRGFPLLTGGIS